MKEKLGGIGAKLTGVLHVLHRFALIGFVLLLFSVYGFLMWRIMSLNQVEPDQSTVQSKLKTAGVPKIDPDTLAKIQELEDNSVDVKTLFEQARQNPFQE